MLHSLFGEPAGGQKVRNRQDTTRTKPNVLNNPTFNNNTPRRGVVPTKKEPHFVPKSPPLCTRKPPDRYQKTPQNVPKKPPNVPRNPRNVPKKPPIDVAGMDTHKCNMHQQKHSFYQKKKKQLSSPCMLHLWTVVYQKAPLQTKKKPGRVTSGFSPPFHRFLQLTYPASTQAKQ